MFQHFLVILLPAILVVAAIPFVREPGDPFFPMFERPLVPLLLLAFLGPSHGGRNAISLVRLALAQVTLAQVRANNCCDAYEMMLVFVANCDEDGDDTY